MEKVKTGRSMTNGNLNRRRNEFGTIKKSIIGKGQAVVTHIEFFFN